MKEDNDDDDENDPLYPTPLIMSDFELLHDDDSVTGKGYLFLSRSSFRNNQGCQPHVISRNEFSRSSPVHAIAELHHMYNRVTWMHTERQKLVKGLRMAKIRLENREALNDEESDFRDYVKWQEEEEADFMTVSAFLTKYGGQTANPTGNIASVSANVNVNGGTGSLPTPTIVSDPNNLFPSLGFSMEPKINEISGIERIRQLDNYGLQNLRLPNVHPNLNPRSNRKTNTLVQPHLHDPARILLRKGVLRYAAGFGTVRYSQAGGEEFDWHEFVDTVEDGI
mmetsp:Transcript_46080/g.55460  ORF Transcript_46080/g.55460 Transcript_46080/m.55460 type:complete len:281 (+) Transcript_46080:465-1307(+)